jgi:hypothetical protein
VVGTWENRKKVFVGRRGETGISCLTADCVRDGSFASVKEEVASIEACLSGRNLALRSRVTNSFQ